MQRLLHLDGKGKLFKGPTLQLAPFSFHPLQHHFLGCAFRKTVIAIGLYQLPICPGSPDLSRISEAKRDQLWLLFSWETSKEGPGL